MFDSLRHALSAIFSHETKPANDTGRVSVTTTRMLTNQAILASRNVRMAASAAHITVEQELMQLEATRAKEPR